MTFNKKMGCVDLANKTVIKRLSIRVLVKQKNRFLMISTKRGDLIFPGGGVEVGESYEAAGRRELREETGYVSTGPMTYMGVVKTCRQDRFDRDSLFESEMHFYRCDVLDQPLALALSENERKLNIQVNWFDKYEIIEKNRAYSNSLAEKDVWVDMVEYVLNHC